MKGIITFFLLNILVVCSQSKNKVESSTLIKPQTTIEINFEKYCSIEKEMKLSEIANSIEYISLETNKNSLLAFITKVIPTRNYLFVKSRGNIYQFQRNGKFLWRLGKSGAGPGEYTIATDFIVDETSEKVYKLTNWSKKILVFTFNGKFVTSIRFNEFGETSRRRFFNFHGKFLRTGKISPSSSTQ